MTTYIAIYYTDFTSLYRLQYEDSHHSIMEDNNAAAVEHSDVCSYLYICDIKF